MHFILSEKLLLKDDLPLLNAYDVRQIRLNIYSKKGIAEQEIMQQIHKKHEQRRIQKNQKDST